MKEELQQVPILWNFEHLGNKKENKKLLETNTSYTKEYSQKFEDNKVYLQSFQKMIST